MIYIKIRSDLYNEQGFDKLEIKYPSFSGRVKAMYRIVKRELETTLEKYPDIDIYLQTKNVRNVLGRFTDRISKEYRRKYKDCYIILYTHCIECGYYNHNVKGLRGTLYHEFIHFKQWLLNERLRHNKKLPASTIVYNIDEKIKLYKKQL